MEYYGTSSNSQPTTPYLTHGPHEMVQSFFTTDTDSEPPDKWLEEDEVSEEELPKPPLPSPPPSCANTSCLVAAFAARRRQLFKAASSLVVLLRRPDTGTAAATHGYM